MVLPPTADQSTSRSQQSLFLQAGKNTKPVVKGERQLLLPSVKDLASSRSASAQADPVQVGRRLYAITGNPESANLEVLREELSLRGYAETCYDEAKRRPSVDLQWGPRRKVDYRNLGRSQRVNHFEMDSELTIKSGLAQNLQSASALCNAEEFYPVAYFLNSTEEFENFSRDFQFSKALSLLKAWLLHHDAAQPQEETFEAGVVQIALMVVQRKLDDLDQHLDSEANTAEQTEFLVHPHEWQVLREADFDRPSLPNRALQQHRLRRSELRRGQHFILQRYSQSSPSSPQATPGPNKQTGATESRGRRNQTCDMTNLLAEYWRADDVNQSSEGRLEEEETSDHGPSGLALLEAVRDTIDVLKRRPQFGLHLRNIWIMKPANGLRGQGIIVEKDLESILQHARSKGAGTFVCQKYIENPLLIGGTRKHDIRQWVLVTSINPLKIWLFSECYVRVAANEYSLENLDDHFQHLTHTIIMCNHPNFDPDDDYWRCQWDQETYQRLLQEKAGFDVWNSKVLPAIKNIVINTLLTVQEALSAPDGSDNCFQLFGYDFLVDSSFDVWLLEVNDIPMLHASGPVTERLCDPCLRDALRLVLDGPERETSCYPKFEMLYSGPHISKCMPETGSLLTIEGKSIARPKNLPPVDAKTMQREFADRHSHQIQELAARRRQQEEKELQKREKQVRLRHLLASKLLGSRGSAPNLLQQGRGVEMATGTA